METPTFKQLLMRDVHQVFLNPEEYGERHRVNGKVILHRERHPGRHDAPARFQL